MNIKSHIDHVEFEYGCQHFQKSELLLSHEKLCKLSVILFWRCKILCRQTNNSLIRSLRITVLLKVCQHDFCGNQLF